VTVLAVTGLNRESAIVAGPGVAPLASGGDIATLAARIEAALSSNIKGVISIGIAGALDPSLKVGDAVIDINGDRFWSDRLVVALPHARRGVIVGSNDMMTDAAAKGALRQASGALCVDMESHVAAKAAARHRLPFVALRFISDGADRALPKAAQAGMKPDGGMDIVAVLKSLAADPRQLPALIRTGMEAQTAFRALSLGRSRLGAALGFADVQGVHFP
jgi:adenosylhomocysteine nucleosidase